MYCFCCMSVINNLLICCSFFFEEGREDLVKLIHKLLKKDVSTHIYSIVNCVILDCKLEHLHFSYNFILIYILPTLLNTGKNSTLYVKPRLL